MNHPFPDLTFSPSEVVIVLKEYVCAICHADLVAQPIVNEARVFILCPEHGNVCLCGRVMRSTVSIKHETSYRDFYPALSLFPDLFGDIWARGIPEESAQKIAREYVCSLCGDEMIPQAIFENGRLVSGKATLACRSRHGNAGLSGLGMVRKEEYDFIPPVDVRRIVRQRAQIESVEPIHFEQVESSSFSKIGAVSMDETYLRVVPFDRNPKLIARIKQEFGEKPTRLTVRMIADKRPGAWECYNRGALIARVVRENGAPRWVYFRDPETQEIEIRGGTACTTTGLRMMQAPVDLNMTVYTNSKGESIPLQAVYRLRFVIPSLTNLDGSALMGYFELSAKGENALSIEAGVQNAKIYAFETGRMLPEIPLTLTIQDGRTVLNPTEKEN